MGVGLLVVGEIGAEVELDSLLLLLLIVYVDTDTDTNTNGDGDGDVDVDGGDNAPDARLVSLFLGLLSLLDFAVLPPAAVIDIFPL